MVQRRLSRQESRQQTRERLLEAATKVFSKRGFYEASLDEVAEEAGFSKGAVYSNFANKEGLFMALLDRHLKVELQNVTSQFTQEGKEGEFYFTSIFCHSFRRTTNMEYVEHRIFALCDASSSGSTAISRTLSSRKRSTSHYSARNAAGKTRHLKTFPRIYRMGTPCTRERPRSSGIFGTRGHAN